MRFSPKFLFFCIASAVLPALSGRALAATLYVGTCHANSYTTIQAAVTAASSGATIEVCPGTYPEQVLITQSLTLTGIQGTSNGLVQIVPPAGGLAANGFDIFANPVAAQVFVQGAGYVKINHFVVDATGNNLAGCGGPTLEGIYYQNSSGEIKNNTVSNQFQTNFAADGGCQNGLAINVESLTSSNAVKISGNSVRAYQKNGITATGAGTGLNTLGPVVTITENAIVGLAATAMNWPGGAAENGIQVGFGATGSITGNAVEDNIWWSDTSSDPGDAASGILVYASAGVNVIQNRVASSQFGITVDSDPLYGTADGTTITDNKVVGTQIFDAIDLCSNTNVVTSNLVFNSTESGIHIDDSCGGTGNNNTVTGNEVHDSCAGILLGTGTGNTNIPNTFYTVANTTLGGDVCPAPSSSVLPASVKGAAARHARLHPSPFKPAKK